MARIRVPLNNFSFGEVSPSLRSRTDSPVYVAAAESVKNFFIRAEGGVINRPGTERIYEFGLTYDASLAQQVRLEPFIFSDDEKYIIAFSNVRIDIFRIATNGTVSHVQTLTTDVNGDAVPFDNNNIVEFTYTQKGDFMFIAHRTFLCRELVRTGLTTFEMRVFEFDQSIDGNKKHQPYYNFQGAGTTITSSGTSGTVTLTCSQDYFASGHVGTRLLIGETEALISVFTNATTVTAILQGELTTQLDIDALKTKKDSNKVEVTHVLHGLASGATVVIAEAGGLGGIAANNINGSRTISRIIDDNKYEITAGASATSEADGGGSPTVKSGAATTEWYEQSYSALRGFPQAITFHEDRLWFGGTPSQPDGLWGSKTGYYFNFDVGEAEDDDAIDLDASVGVTNQIRHLVSNRDLQVFASQSEFYVPAFQDAPVTPAKAKVSLQTPVGSGYVRPQSLDGATLFVQATGTAIREYIFSDSEAAYTSTMVSLLSSHLVTNPVQLTTLKGSLARPGAYGIFIMDNGEIAVFHSLRDEKRAGWMRWETEGRFHSVCAVDEDLFAVSIRDTGGGTNKLVLEQFNTSMKMDFCNTFDGSLGSASTCTITVTDYANIAVGTTITFTKSDGSTVVFTSEAAGGSSPTTALNWRPNTNNDTTADNIFTAVNAHADFVVSNPSANVVTITEASPTTGGALSVATSDSTRLASTNQSKVGVFPVSSHFANGATVEVVDGTEFLGTFTVASGNVDVSAVKLSTAAQIGYRFTPELKTLPIDGAVPGGPLTGAPRKITKVTLDLENTLSVSVNGTDMIIRTVQQNQASGVAAVSGKEEFRVLGYSKDPRVTISQSAPLPIQINGLVTEVAF